MSKKLIQFNVKNVNFFGSHFLHFKYNKHKKIKKRSSQFPDVMYMAPGKNTDKKIQAYCDS